MGAPLTGMWVFSKWKKSSSLEELVLSDADDARNTLLYTLSKDTGMECFRTVLLVASPQDRYVTLSSAMAHTCAQADSDRKLGPVYQEMVRRCCP